MRSTQRGGVTRREILAAAVGSAAASWLATPALARVPATRASAEPLFKISLAQWSLHRALKGGQLAHLDFPKTAKNDYGIDAIEYVNVFFKSPLQDDYLTGLKKRCDDLGVKSLLIMCDGEGELGDPDDSKRATAVENHRKWLDAAKALGCHSIRVNAQSKGTREEQAKLAADGLARLGNMADSYGLNVIVENHGGLSSHGDWLAGVMKAVGSKRVGTLPDFGNFYEYDRYEGVRELMPFAKGVSAKSHEFNDKGDEVKTDYRRMLRIVLDAGYRGHIGIEYEGDKHTEGDGIKLTKALLERIRDEVAPSYPASTTPGVKPEALPAGGS